MSGVGAARQPQAQRGIDLARQEFEAEEAFPLQTLQEFSSILRGFPIAPTRTTSTREFSAAQPLSTQLLGVGTQALGALGAAGIKPFGQAGGMVREMPVKAQSGGALSSLMEKTQDLDTSPVLGMKRGGSFMEQLLTGGLLSTDKAINMAKKLPAPVTSMLGGAGLPKLLNPMGSRAQAPAAAARPSQEELDKQIDAMLRQRAAQGQQMASRGAGPAQVGAQMGQVRQPFKGGGGLRQMVQLPTKQMANGGMTGFDAFRQRTADARAEKAAREEEIRNLQAQRQGLFPQVGAFFTQPAGTVDQMQARNLEIDEAIKQLKTIGAAPAALAAAAKDDASQVEEASELDIAPAPKAPKAKKTPAPAKKKKGEDLYRSPEEAAYASLMDSKAGQRAAERYFKGENVTLANISEALKAYKGFKDTEMAQRRAINEANIKKAAAARAARTADAELALTQGQVRTELDKPTAERIKALNSLLQAKVATLSDTYMQTLDASDPRKAKLLQEVKMLEEQLQPFLTLPSPALRQVSELVGISSVKPLSKKAT